VEELDGPSGHPDKTACATAYPVDVAPSTGVRAAVVLIGATAAVAQIVLMRELMVVFSGNEISLGLMLASWLFWTAAGSAVAGRLIPAGGDSRRWMAGFETLAAAALPLTILVVRTGKAVLQPVPEVSLGPGVMLLGSLAALSFFCFFSGALFAAGSRLCAREADEGVARATGSVYVLEAIGFAVGGVSAGLVLVRFLDAMQIGAAVALLNLLAAVGLAIRTRMVRLAVVGGLIVAFGWAIPFACPRLEARSIQRFWRGFHVLATRNSAYGNLVVVGTEGNRSLYENGLVLFTAPDPAGAEESVHYALLEHPAPRSLLLIGGGVNGSLAEALRHPSLRRVDYVELDPAILELARSVFPREWAPIEADPRVQAHVTDGRLFLKTTDLTFDVIIVNLPDPQTAQLNRFYTVEFFREAAAKLNPTGLLSFRLTSSENYISPELAEFLRSIHKTLRAVFPEVAVIPGETVHFFAAKRAGILAAGPVELVSRLRTRGLDTTYVREYFIPYRMSPDRRSDLESRIRPSAETPVNRDLAPVAYYFDMALWNSRFHAAYSAAFRWLAAVPFGGLTIALTVLVIALAAAARMRRGEGRLRAVAGFCTAAMGFTMIGLEILILLAFQAIYGSVYEYLAAVIGAFMAGMGLGSWVALRGDHAPGGLGRDQVRMLAILQALAACAPLALFALFRTVAHVTSAGGLSFVGPVLFPCLACVCGAIGGYEFPVASRVYFAASKRRNPGTLYALDLAGSCVGAVLFSAYLVPVFGFLRAGALAGIVSLAPGVLAVWTRARSGMVGVT